MAERNGKVERNGDKTGMKWRAKVSCRFTNKIRQFVFWQVFKANVMSPPFIFS